MWVIDIRHWLNDNYDGPAVPQLALKVAKIKEIIIYATSACTGRKAGLAPGCWRRPQRKPCKGILDVKVVGQDEIRWFCPVCGDEGVVRGWTSLNWNMSSSPNDTVH